MKGLETSRDFLTSEKRRFENTANHARSARWSQVYGGARYTIDRIAQQALGRLPVPPELSSGHIHGFLGEGEKGKVSKALIGQFGRTHDGIPIENALRITPLIL